MKELLKILPVFFETSAKRVSSTLSDIGIGVGTVAVVRSVAFDEVGLVEFLKFFFINIKTSSSSMKIYRTI
jgi:hypothetical protein